MGLGRKGSDNEVPSYNCLQRSPIGTKNTVVVCIEQDMMMVQIKRKRAATILEFTNQRYMNGQNGAIAF